VGVYLNTDVFSHRQLYVALSRVSDVKNLLVEKPANCRGVVNVVHKRMFAKETKRKVGSTPDIFSRKRLTRVIQQTARKMEREVRRRGHQAQDRRDKGKASGEH
jgi:hypothetical protein